MSKVEQVLDHIEMYCNQIADAVNFFGDDYELFCSNRHYSNDIAFCLLQIGELAGKLPMEYQTQTKDEITWSKIRGMRNIIAHDYYEADLEVIWNTVKNNIPQLGHFCHIQIQEMKADGSRNQGKGAIS